MKMKKIKRVMLLAAALVAIIIAMSGCQLAQPDGNAASAQDKFIGVYITFESLEETAKLAGVQPEAVTGKIVALKTTEPDSGTEHTRYEFPKMNGAAMFVPRIHGADPDQEHYACFADPTLNQVSITCGSSETSVSGTIYILPGHDTVVILNPVYQTADGQVYMLPSTDGGTGMSSESGTMTLTKDMQNTVTYDGQTTKSGGKASLIVEIAKESSEYIVRQFNTLNEAVAATTIRENAIPEQIAADPAMAYAIVETIDGDQVVEREIIDWTIGTHSFLFFNESGLGIGHAVSLAAANELPTD